LARRLVAVEVKVGHGFTLTPPLARAGTATATPTRAAFDGDKSPAESGDKSPHSKARRAGAAAESEHAAKAAVARKWRRVEGWFMASVLGWTEGGVRQRLIKWKAKRPLHSQRPRMTSLDTSHNHGNEPPRTEQSD